ncbi:Fc.00g047050.m01.CDS01 [Cosmosporella sp. VM-42]
MSFWRRPFSERKTAAEAQERGADDIGGEISDGSVHYVVKKAGNDSEVSYQDAIGAPVEVSSPLGYSAGPVTIVFLNISKMIGTGIFSTREHSLEVVYLEQAFPRPKWLFPTAFAFQAVVLSFSSGNAIVLAQYLFGISGHDPSNWELKAVAIAGYTLAVLLVAFNTRFSYWFSNGIGIIKVLTLLLITIAGFVVLGGNIKSIPEPKANFHNSFEGESTAYGLTNALYKIIFSYAGYENAFNVVNEVKNPIRQIKVNGVIALFTVTLLYILTNIAYLAAIPKKEIMSAKQVTATLFFEKVFSSSGAARGLNFLIALSALGNLIAVLLGTSRIIRECGRQGVLPFPRFWASTRPFGTALGPYIAKWVITIIMILAPPAGDAFNFITDLKIYPAAFFDFLMALGLIIIRRRRKRLGLPRPTFRTWDIVLYFNILKNVYLLVMPWYPPDGGPYSGDVSFWYATYAATGLGILGLCGGYHWLWVSAIPKLRGYKVCQEIIDFEDGAQSQHLVKVPLAELEAWEANHDVSGRRLSNEIPATEREKENSGKEDVDTDSNKAVAK